MAINPITFGQQYGAVNPFNPNVGSSVNVRPQTQVGGGQPAVTPKQVNTGNPFIGKSAGEIDFEQFQAYKAAVTGANNGNPVQPVIFNPEAKPVDPVTGVSSEQNQSVATAAWIANGGAPVDSLGTGFSQNLFGQQNVAGKRLQLWT